MANTEPKFFFVNFTGSLPYTDCNNYEWIPHTWILSYDPNEKTAIIKFPNTKSAHSNVSINSCPPYNKDWIGEYSVRLVQFTNDYHKTQRNLPTNQASSSFAMGQARTELEYLAEIDRKITRLAESLQSLRSVVFDIHSNF